MPLSHIEHFLVQTTDIARTRDWFVRVLGMKEGYHPDFKFPVCWLYIGDRDVVHITEGGANVSENRRRYVGQESQATSGTGVIDHIAFRAIGLRETMAHLTRIGVDFKQRQVSDQGLYQLFLFDPNGIKIELNFDNAEALAHGIKPELMASDLPH
ncbi:MAG TPA: VOC family protein [Burkholderiales bacterium]|nr:VOC family protein [Burkholderiales bacterium]